MYCVAHGIKHGGKKETALGKLVKKPFPKFEKGTRRFLRPRGT
jgi:hypothetical protein